jgi:polysaccharide biosynthesis protein PelF
MDSPSLFKSFFIGGFEASTHCRHADGRRLDLIASTQHDRFAVQDYERLHSLGIRTARDGIRWHLIEQPGGRYDWSSVIPMLRAARETRTQVIWDLLHFGWPSDVDIFEPAFVDRFGRFARAFMQVLVQETDETPFIAPINEPSFLSFAAGEKGFFFPFAHRRGGEMKAQFVRGTVAACAAARDVHPGTRLVHTDPVINIIADPRKPWDRLAAEQYRLAQFEAWDMIAGRARPDLGGQRDYLDILGLNYYIQNQWIHDGGGVLVPTHPQHLPFRYFMREAYERYSRPVFISETGIEAEVRPDWLRYMGQEVRGALQLGVPVEGLCLYPIVDHPGWEDDRHCPNGVWGYADETGHRDTYAPLADEIRRQQSLLERLRAGEAGAEEEFEHGDWNVLNAAAHAMDIMTTRSRT